MKKLLFTLAASMLFCSVAAASPLMDYSSGKASIDLMWNDTKTTTTGYESLDASKKFNLDSSITLGLGNNFALQYRNFEPKGIYTTAYSSVITSYIGMKTYEINVLKKLNNSNVAVFFGVAPTRIMEGYEISALTGFSENNYGGTKNNWQVGFITEQNIGSKTKIYEQAAIGKKWTNLECGVSYPITTNIEFNANYRYIKAKDLPLPYSNYITNYYNVIAKGLGVGVTYKF